MHLPIFRRQTGLRISRWFSTQLSDCLGLILFGMSVFFWSAQDVSAQRYPEGMKEGRNSARSPTTDGGVVTFTILPGDCQARTYGDGRGESDCKNLNSKSYLAAGDVPVGTGMRYAFEVRVASGLTHTAFHTPRAVPFTGGLDSRLSVAIWQGNLIKNHLVSLDLDKTRGLTFLGRHCATPGDLSSWTRFEMLVKWSRKSVGVMQVKCNGRIVYTVNGAPTDQAPHCHISNHCEPGVEKHPKRINAGFGVFFDKEVVRGVPTKPRVPTTGLSIQMRNLELRKVRLR